MISLSRIIKTRTSSIQKAVHISKELVIRFSYGEQQFVSRSAAGAAAEGGEFTGDFSEGNGRTSPKNHPLSAVSP